MIMSKKPINLVDRRFSLRYILDKTMHVCCLIRRVSITFVSCSLFIILCSKLLYCILGKAFFRSWLDCLTTLTHSPSCLFTRHLSFLFALSEYIRDNAPFCKIYAIRWDECGVDQYSLSIMITEMIWNGNNYGKAFNSKIN